MYLSIRSKNKAEKLLHWIMWKTCEMCEMPRVLHFLTSNSSVVGCSEHHSNFPFSVSEVLPFKGILHGHREEKPPWCPTLHGVRLHIHRPLHNKMGTITLASMDLAPSSAWHTFQISLYTKGHYAEIGKKWGKWAHAIPIPPPEFSFTEFANLWTKFHPEITRF